MTVEVIFMICLLLITIIVELIDYQVEKRNIYEKCHENRKGICKDILDEKICNKCPYMIKTRSI